MLINLNGKYDYISQAVDKILLARKLTLKRCQVSHVQGTVTCEVQLQGVPRRGFTVNMTHSEGQADDAVDTLASLINAHLDSGEKWGDN